LQTVDCFEERGPIARDGICISVRIDVEGSDAFAAEPTNETIKIMKGGMRRMDRVATCE